MSLRGEIVVFGGLASAMRVVYRVCVGGGVFIRVCVCVYACVCVYTYMHMRVFK